MRTDFLLARLAKKSDPKSKITQLVSSSFTFSFTTVPSENPMLGTIDLKACMFNQLF